MELKNIKPYHYIYVLVVIVVVVGAWFSYNSSKPVMLLPIYGELNADSSYHSIPAFSFTDQSGVTVTNQTFDSGVYLTDFFFTHCPSICPKMSGNLEELAGEFKDEPRLKILSHTVDPMRDSVSVLLKYSKKYNANPEQWHFVTGAKSDLYDIARKGYYLSATQGDGGENDFVHTQNMALVDWNRHIRGFYDGTDKIAMKKCATDIKLLLKEYDWKKNNK